MLKIGLWIFPKHCKIKISVEDKLNDLPLELAVVTPSVRCKRFWGICRNKNTGSATLKDGVEGVIERSTMVNILDAANFIIQLYFKTGKKYRCSRTKVEKLLVIAQLISIKDNNQSNKLLSEKICSNPCGAGFPVLSKYLFSEIIDTEEDESGNAIDCSLIKEDAEYPVIYRIVDEDSFTPTIRKILRDVFLEFGNCKIKELGEWCNQFKDNIVSSTEKEYDRYVIDEQRVIDYFSNSNMCYSGNSNRIVEYIHNYKF